MKTIIVLSGLFWAGLFAQTQYAPMTINNWIYWQKNDGNSAQDPQGVMGGIFPKETAAVIYQDALVWGGKVQDSNPDKPQLRAGGQYYVIGTQPGWIQISGSLATEPLAISEEDPRVRIYRIRRDFDQATDKELINDVSVSMQREKAQVTSADVAALRATYQKDWQEWPADLGAPYYDRNRNGVWDADFDEPGIVDADQVIWYVFNDLDAGKSMKLFGSPPIGLEVQVTVWAYKQTSGALANTIFKRYKIINRSGFEIDSMYFGQYSEPDIGDFTDDFNGCDSVMNMGHSYNGRAQDKIFDVFNMAPPAVAYVVLQGPVISLSGIQAMFDFKTKDNTANLPLTSFWHKATASGLSDPIMGHHDGTIHVYGMLQGYAGTTPAGLDYPMYHGAGSNKGETTCFPVNGDPVAGTGDIDGIEDNMGPGNRRFMLSSGPFIMKDGDVQEFVVAIVGGLGNEPGNNIAAVADLQQKVPALHQFYQGLTEFEAPQGPRNDEEIYLPEANTFILGQNYPNPFNSYTKIRLQVFETMDMELSVWNVLGQKVRTLVNHSLHRGEYQFDWDGKNEQKVSLPSGIYFMRLQSGARIQWRKMVYLK